MMEFNSHIYVAGHTGLVGSTIARSLKKQGYRSVIGVDSSTLDLRKQDKVEEFFSVEKPNYVFLAAAKVGGILANSRYPADFIYDNLMIQTNVIEAARKYGTKKLLFLGSSCIYPKMSRQPIQEKYLLSGHLEPTNEAYAVAKIAGIEMCKMYKRQYGFNAISVMPTNLYGERDNFDPNTSHVIPGMIAKFLKAKEMKKDVVLWGDGTPMREFLYVDDLADACIFLMNNYDGEEHINVGSPDEVSIKELAEMIAKKVGFKGNIVWDELQPNGTPRKKLHTKKIEKLGWKPTTSLSEGLDKTIEWYKNELS